MILAKTLHGSRLYGLDGPTSDFDYKTIHLPPIRDCLLLSAVRNVHTKGEEKDLKMECESFAIQEFISLAARGEDVAMCMLHADRRHIIQDSPTFYLLRKERTRFYTKGMDGQLGYCKSQAVKYSLRADRLATVETVISILEGMVKDGVMKVGQAWDRLPELPHTKKGENLLDRGADKRAYEVAGKIIPATVAPLYALDILTKLRDSYGNRVRAARNMEGDDLKAISHSFRVGYQLRSLFTRGTFSFPLDETNFIKAVKYGELNYADDQLDECLNDLISEVEEMAAKSTFPEKVDACWLDSLVLNTYRTHYTLPPL